MIVKARSAVRGLLVGAALVMAASSRSLADPPSSILAGVRLHLSTTTLVLPVTHYTTMTKTGSIATYLKWKKETIQLPATVLDGYQVRSSGDPKLVLTGASSPSQLVDGTRRNDVIFVTEDELVQIRFPKPALVYTGRATLLDIPISNVLTVEKRDGPFDGHTAYGEPFYMPRDRALLLRDQTPGFSCAIKASAGDSYWVSCVIRASRPAFRSMPTTRPVMPSTYRSVATLGFASV